MSMYDTVHYVYIYVYIYTIAPSAGLFTLLVSLGFLIVLQWMTDPVGGSHATTTIPIDTCAEMT